MYIKWKAFTHTHPSNALSESERNEKRKTMKQASTHNKYRSNPCHENQMRWEKLREEKNTHAKHESNKFSSVFLLLFVSSLLSFSFYYHRPHYYIHFSVITCERFFLAISLSLSTFETLLFVLKLKLSIHQIWWWSGGCQRIRPNEWREKIEQIQCVWYKLMSRMGSFTGESNKHRVESLHSKLQSRLTTMIHLIIN